MGACAIIAIVTAPRFIGEPSSYFIRWPVGKIPTVLFSFNNLIGFFNVLGPGFSLSTGKALSELKNPPNHLLLNNSFGHIMNLIWINSHT